jgi:4-carboxymuconolactone decarboxylase
MAERLRRLAPEEMTEEQRRLYEAILDDGRRGERSALVQPGTNALRGPMNALLYSPAVGDALQRLGSAIRFETELGDRVRELAILTVAVSCESEYEWVQHEAIARRLGVSEADLVAVRDGGALSDPHEDAVCGLVRLLDRGGDLDDAHFTRAIELVGNRGMVELTALVGYYRTLAQQLSLFRVVAPRREPPPG